MFFIRSFSEQNRKILRMALIASPLMALYSVTPLAIFISAFSEYIDLPFTEDMVPRIALGTGLIMVVVFIQWLINTLLLNERFKHNWIRYAISFPTTLVIMLLIMFIFTLAGPPRPPGVEVVRIYPFIGAIANNTFVIILIELITTRSKKAQLEIEKAQLEVAHLIARNEELKHKIHPHFLFNALGTLKVLATQDPELAQKYISRLSSFLRSSLAESIHEQVSIQKELDFLEDYMALQRMRFKDALSFKYHIPESIRMHGMLPVFTLQFLAENAVKHNAFTTAKPLLIEVSYLGDKRLSFSNNLVPKYVPEPSTGIGLANLSERFALLNAARPKVHLDEQAERFTVEVEVLGV